MASVHDDADLLLGPLRLRLRTSSPLLRETLIRFLPEGLDPSSDPFLEPARDSPGTFIALEAFEGPLRKRRTRIREGALCQGAWRRGERSLWILEGQGLEEARARLHGESPATAQAAVKQFLRGFLPEWFLCHGGLVVHGATLVHRRQAFVFLAPSGGGKTTLARDHRAEGCLGDDAAFLWQDPAAGRWWALPSPLPGREQVPVTAPAAPLAGIFRLRKARGGTGRCSGVLRTHRAIGEVLARARVDVGLAPVRALLLDRVLELVRSRPVRVLALPMHHSPWPLVDEACGVVPGTREAP